MLDEVGSAAPDALGRSVVRVLPRLIRALVAEMHRAPHTRDLTLPQFRVLSRLSERDGRAGSGGAKRARLWRKRGAASSASARSAALDESACAAGPGGLARRGENARACSLTRKAAQQRTTDT